MATRKTSAKSLATESEAARLAQLIHELGDYAHVSVKAERGHLCIYVGDDEDAVARLTPVAGGYGLSFHNHTGRWEPMPVSGEMAHVARDMISHLGIYFDKIDFSPRNSGSGY